jgi:hypothetical protein
MRWIFFCVQLICLMTSPYAFGRSSLVTYQLSGGRFGDNLIAYMHTKWVSYRYNIPLAYCNFPYANQLMLEMYEKKIGDSYEQQKILNQRDDLDSFMVSEGSTLYVIPYFPESEYELAIDTFYPYFKVDWDDPEFKVLLKKMIAPKQELPKFDLPKERISVALHIRRGGGHDGGFDSPVTTNPSYPLKFPSQQFYLSAVRRLYFAFGEKPLYIRIFTDDIFPHLLKREFEDYFKNFDILWSCRENNNRHDANVLEDFFALTQFDCSIHGESNFPLSAGKIADYQIEIMPKTFHWDGGEPIVDSVVVKGKNKRIVEGYHWNDIL